MYVYPWERIYCDILITQDHYYQYQLFPLQAIEECDIAPMLNEIFCQIFMGGKIKVVEFRRCHWAGHY